jgi:2-polyprenyl-3-methyl-5-hydroxy-6-metoxy-1,4-benzoquinol methylase
MTHEHEWDEHQEFEAGWWGQCTNTFGEETKQITYAHRMGLINEPFEGHWPSYDLGGRSVLDLGGGPTSLLLKARNLKRAAVVDPCPYPKWVDARYEAANITYIRAAAEGIDVETGAWDEAWIYNVLQHVQDPEAIIANAREAATVVRLFEWVDLPPHLGHPHELKAADLSRWLGGPGTVEQMNENGCVGRAFYGVFPVSAE